MKMRFLFYGLLLYLSIPCYSELKFVTRRPSTPIPTKQPIPTTSPPTTIRPTQLPSISPTKRKDVDLYLKTFELTSIDCDTINNCPTNLICFRNISWLDEEKLSRPPPNSFCGCSRSLMRVLNISSTPPSCQEFHPSFWVYLGIIFLLMFLNVILLLCSLRGWFILSWKRKSRAIFHFFLFLIISILLTLGILIIEFLCLYDDTSYFVILMDEKECSLLNTKKWLGMGTICACFTSFLNLYVEWYSYPYSRFPKQTMEENFPSFVFSSSLLPIFIAILILLFLPSQYSFLGFYIVVPIIVYDCTRAIYVQFNIKLKWHACLFLTFSILLTLSSLAIFLIYILQYEPKKMTWGVEQDYWLRPVQWLFACIGIMYFLIHFIMYLSGLHIARYQGSDVLMTPHSDESRRTGGSLNDETITSPPTPVSNPILRKLTDSPKKFAVKLLNSSNSSFGEMNDETSESASFRLKKAKSYGPLYANGDPTNLSEML